MATPEEALPPELIDEEMAQEMRRLFEETGGGDEEGEAGDFSGLTEDQIVAIIQHDIESADTGETSDDRVEALDYYMGRKRGDEIAGRSQVISTDVADVVEWVLPEVLKAFNSPESTVRFDAIDEEDEEVALLETEATHYEFFVRNSGFLNLYTMVKDALLLRNAVMKVYQDTSVKVSRETREGLNDIEFAEYLQPDDGTEVYPIAHEPYEVMAPAPPEMQQAGITEIPLTLHNVTIKRVRSQGRRRIEAIPPECFLYSRGHNSLNLDEVPFCAHEREATESQLISEGWDSEMIRALPTYNYTDEDGVRSSRRPEGIDPTDYDLSNLDTANRPIKVYECYKTLDIEGDGMPELYMIHVAGDAGGYQMMGYEPVEENPFVGTTCIIMTHAFEGRSLFDRCKQIQDTKTSLQRNLLDNIYFQNNQRHEVVTGMVNLDDMLTNRPGGMVRVKAPGMVNPIPVNPTGVEIYRYLEYLDHERGNKTGISPDDMRQNNRLPQDSAHGIERIMSAKEELVGLFIRILAETGVAPVMLKTRNLLVRHQDSEMPIKVSGKWKRVDPRNWRDTRTTTVTVGLGTGDRSRQLQVVREVITQQAQVAMGGGFDVLVTHKHMHRAFTDFVRFSQLGSPEDYWQDPDSDEAKEAIERQRAEQEEQATKQEQMETMLVQMQAQLEDQDQKLKNSQEMARLAFDYRELSEKVATEMTKLEVQSGKNVPESRV